MKALIVTYYWPPAGGSGVQRWLYFVKYLKDFGIEPVVFTVENPNYPIDDTSLNKQIPDDIEIIKQKIFEPNSFFTNKTLQTGAGFLQQNPSLFQKILHYIRANFFIPDARKFWIKPSVKTISKYLQNNTIDWLITTGPPHSVHLIGKDIQSKFSIKWLADFRDPWTEIDYFHQLPLTSRSLKRHTFLENSVLSSADLVTVVGNTMQKNYSAINKNCHVITNGFDGAVMDRETLLDKKFTMTHVGSLNADRNPEVFWKTIHVLIDEVSNFKQNVSINVIGKAASEVYDSIQTYRLEAYVNFIDYIPHEEVFSKLKSSQVLLLFVNKVPSAKAIVTGKVFEYLRVQRPIIAVAPTNGDLAEIINETETGTVIAFDDGELLKQNIHEYFRAFELGNLGIDSKAVQQYHRKNLTAQLAELLKNN